jgi:cystathionine beta-lyase
MGFPATYIGAPKTHMGFPATYTGAPKTHMAPHKPHKTPIYTYLFRPHHDRVFHNQTEDLMKEKEGRGKYNFDAIVARHGTNSIKYDFAIERGKPLDCLPMWVADMDFPSPPEVLLDIQRVLNHGILGYTEPKDDYYNAVISWFKTHFGFYATKSEIIKTPGIVFAISQAVRAFTNPGDAVLIQTPVYFPFFDIVRDNARTLVTNELIYSGSSANTSFKYTIDLEDFEKKIVENDVKLFILCSPHNPIGRVWTSEELQNLNSICTRHSVTIISDEIHCDFVWPGNTHICFGSINEDSVIATSPGKTFNIAGLQVSNIFVKNALLREKLKTEIGLSGYSQLNTLAVAACQSAYTSGGEWLVELKKYLLENISIAKDFLMRRIPRIKLVEPEATYLLWLDFSAYGLSQKELER